MNNLAPITPQALLERFRAEDGHENPAGYEAYLRNLFGDVELKNKRVLEIGSGRGLLTLHCALAGAEKVVSLEPEMEGSTSGVVATQQRRAEALACDNIEIRKQDFNTADWNGQEFDVVVMIAVLNHLYETPKNAARDREVYDRFVSLFHKLHQLTSEGGVVIATDACRYSLWTQLRRVGLPRRFCLAQRTIDWRIHQQPKTWEKIFLSAGFSRVRIDYPIPYRCRRYAGVLRNRWANFLLFGEFVLKAWK